MRNLEVFADFAANLPESERSQFIGQVADLLLESPKIGQRPTLLTLRAAVIFTAALVIGLGTLLPRIGRLRLPPLLCQRVLAVLGLTY